MKDSELVFNFQVIERELIELGYKISSINTCFFIHNNKGTIVGEVHSIDGLRGFLQGVEWASVAPKDSDAT